MRKSLLGLGLLALVPVLAILRGQGPREQPHGNLDKDCGECHSPERWMPIVKPSRFRHETTGFPLEGRTRRPPAAGATARSSSTTSGPPAPTATRTRTAASSARAASRATRPRPGPTSARWSRSTTARGCRCSRRTPGSTARPATATSSPTSTRTTPAECGNCHLRRTSRPRTRTTRPPASRAAARTATASRRPPGRARPSRTPRASRSRAATPTSRAPAATAPAARTPSRRSASPATSRLHVGREPEPQRGRLPAHLRGLPHDRLVAAREVRSLRDELPADRSAHAHRVRTLPRGRALRRHAEGLQLLPPAGLRAHHEPEPPGERLPDDVRELPLDERLAPGELRPRQDPLPADGRALAASTARAATRAGATRARPRTATPATRPDYARTTNPNHVASGFPTTCESCHSTSAWRPANFDHAKTRFPLTGAHTRVDCASCHAGGRYAGTPTACSSCHQADYAGTTNPNHQAAGFPTNCAELPHHERLAAGELRPRRPLLPDLLRKAQGQVVELLRLPRQPEQLQGLRVHAMPRAFEP